MTNKTHGAVRAAFDKSNPLGHIGNYTNSSNSVADQRARLLAALRIGPISTLDARSRLDVLHPAARIQELREAGHQIVTEWYCQETFVGCPHRVAKYVLLAVADGGAL